MAADQDASGAAPDQGPGAAGREPGTDAGGLMASFPGSPPGLPSSALSWSFDTDLEAILADLGRPLSPDED